MRNFSKICTTSSVAYIIELILQKIETQSLSLKSTNQRNNLTVQLTNSMIELFDFAKQFIIIFQKTNLEFKEHSSLAIPLKFFQTSYSPSKLMISKNSSHSFSYNPSE